jgi:hypothetical protein
MCSADTVADLHSGKEVSHEQAAERTTHNGAEIPVGLPSSKDLMALPATSQDLASPAGARNTVPVGLPSSRDVMKMTSSRLQSSADSSNMVPLGLPSSRDVLKIPASGFTSLKDRTHELSAGNKIYKQRPSGTDRRRVEERSNERLVVQISTESNAVTGAVPKLVSPKSPKIGSGRLSRAENGNSSKKSTQQERRNNQRRQNGVWKEEEPVMIGMAVIRTPGDDQSAVVRKGILKPSKETVWKREAVDDEELTIDWNKEVAEAERRKAMEELTNKPNAPKIEGMHCKDGDSLIKDRGVKPSAGRKTVNSKNSKKHSSSQEKHVTSKEMQVSESNAADDDDEWEDVDEDEDYVDEDDIDDDEEDLHDNSSESFDQFIKENTLKLDIECTPQVWPERATDPLTPGSQSDSSGFLKTPTGLVHVLDWGAEMEAHCDTDISLST